MERWYIVNQLAAEHAARHGTPTKRLHMTRSTVGSVGCYGWHSPNECWLPSLDTRVASSNHPMGKR